MTINRDGRGPAFPGESSLLFAASPSRRHVAFTVRTVVEAPVNLTRRELLKQGARTALAAAGAQLPLPLPLARLPYLDSKQYARNMSLHAHLPNVGGLIMQMWARGEQRMLFYGGHVIDVTDPLKPTLVARGAYVGGAHQLCYASHLKKWIMVTGSTPPFTAPRRPEAPRGKYSGLGWKGDEGHPNGTQVTEAGKKLVEGSLNFKGLRGIRTWDATDPTKILLLSEHSTGEKGGGATAPFYDGGQYAYYGCAPDETFIHMESSERLWAYGLLVVDVSDPVHPREVSKWWVPGMRAGEEEAYRRWRFAGDQSSFTTLHGPLYVPKRVEDGGAVGYGSWGHFGMLVHDFTDIRNPKLYATLDPISPPGGIPFHTTMPLITDPSEKRNQNLLISDSEALETDCGDSFLPQYIVDIKDPRKPRIVGRFPRPVPPPDAPYADFCFARGRFASHELTAFNAPGRAPYNFVAMTYQVAGLRIFDIADPTDPKEVAYFIPPRTGDLTNWESWRNGGESGLFVEYDRNLIWIGSLEQEPGLYCVSTPFLGKPVLKPKKVSQWTMSHINAGWDDATPKSVYLGRSASEAG